MTQRQPRSSEVWEFPAAKQRRPAEFFPETRQHRPSGLFPATRPERRSSEVWEFSASRARSNSVQLPGRSRSAATLPTRLPESKLEPLDEISGFYKRGGGSNSVSNKMPQSPFTKKAPRQQAAEPPGPAGRARATTTPVATAGTQQQQNGAPSRSKTVYSPEQPVASPPPPPMGNFFDFDEENVSEDVLTEAPEKLVKQLRQQAKERMRWAALTLHVLSCTIQPLPSVH